MVETQREPVPHVDSGELDTAMAFLAFARHCVLKKTEGLSTNDYRAAIVDSDRAIRAVGDPETRIAIPVDGNRHTLRWVLAHMTSETAAMPNTPTSSASSAAPRCGRRLPVDARQHWLVQEWGPAQAAVAPTEAPASSDPAWLTRSGTRGITAAPAARPSTCDLVPGRSPSDAASRCGRARLST
jgi:hypothetical protein